MKFFEVEIGTAEDPEAVITVRVTADTGQTMGLTCVRACGAAMASAVRAVSAATATSVTTPGGRQCRIATVDCAVANRLTIACSG